MQEIHPLILPCPPPFSTAMSAVDLPDTTSSTAPYKKPAHRRDTSDDELDVFEAASYYSGEADTSFRSGILPYGNMKEERPRAALGGGMRRSIDVPMMAPLPNSQSHKSEKQTKEKETKQPISPGGRLASFLNSFFHQGSKKKSKSISATSSSSTPQYSCKDGDHSLESPSGRRKRRSSISHSRSTGRSSDSSGSGFRTPSLVFPRGKAKEDPRITSQRNKYCSAGVLQGAPPGAAASPPATVQAFHEGSRSCGGYGDLPWERSRRASTNGILDQKGGCSYHGAKSVVLGGGGAVAEKKWVLNKDSRGIACTDLLPDDGPLAKERSVWKREENEDDGESDSSSDLFELPNCALVHSFASGLPVYETTSMESIKRGTSMSSVAL